MPYKACKNTTEGSFSARERLASYNRCGVCQRTSLSLYRRDTGCSELGKLIEDKRYRTIFGGQVLAGKAES